FFQAEDGIRVKLVTGVQTCALPISRRSAAQTDCRPLERIRIGSPFVLRSAEPAPAELAGRVVRGLRRLGKRIVIGLDGDVYAVRSEERRVGKECSAGMAREE